MTSSKIQQSKTLMAKHCLKLTLIKWCKSGM